MLPNETPREFDRTPTIEELAARQGVQPIADARTLLGHPSPEDESVEEFEAMLREWRGKSPIKT